MRSSNIYQILLIISGVLVTALFSIFLYREIFPEYKIYQKDYVALEEFRSSYTHEPIPAFNFEIKQLVLEREDKGPPIIDRCTSCHVALQIPYFSSTKIAYDINGNIMRDQEGRPILVTNEDYIWAKLDQQIADLRDEKIIDQLRNEGNDKLVNERLKQAKDYEALKTAQVGSQVYDVTKVLATHPLMGKETRPFEYHPLEEYGCTSCHNGNGRGLTTEKAHGPVFDDQYEAEFGGFKPHFTESDLHNDPKFAHEFNSKPGAELLFQTQPIFVGALIQSKCMQCHQTSEMQLEQAAMSAIRVTGLHEKQSEFLEKSFNNDKETLLDLLELKKRLLTDGYTKTIEYLKVSQNDYTRSSQDLEHSASQLKYLETNAMGQSDEKNKQKVLDKLNEQIIYFLGSRDLAQALQEAYNQKGKIALNDFLVSRQQDPQAKGVLFLKEEALNYNQELRQHIRETGMSFESALKDQNVISSLSTDVDELTRNYQRGKELYLSQACYACHRISGFARGGVGPELTKIGDSYPWYIKESIVWPQADLKSSTMPNMRLDHEELEDLMAFLLAQKGSNRAVAQSAYQAAIQSWEAGRKMPWEKPIPPSQIYDLGYAMTVFAVEGCASCHRLLGFESNIGFAIEKKDHSFDELYEQQQWFKKLFPEVIRIAQYDQTLPGSQIVTQIEKHEKEIDERIVSDVRKDSILEEIDKNHPQVIEALYSEFKYAARAKNYYYDALIKEEKDVEKIAKIKAEHQSWKDRVHRVLMMYIQQYGLGRLIGPHPNWSGIFRSDEWLMEHFRNPSAHVPRSIMPVLPFDDTKFYALTLMLDYLGVLNRNKTRTIWENRGFNPAEAFQIHCSQCHGINLQGNGPIAEWIYPIPKNLRNSDFLRNLTKERAIYSITHGVRGTPMPPWGEMSKDKSEVIQKQSSNKPVLTANEIQHLVDWLFSSLPSGEVLRTSTDVLKWQYTPEDVLDELRKEGGQLYTLPRSKEGEELKQERNLQEQNLPEENNPPIEPQLSTLFPMGEVYYAAIRPEIYPQQVPRGIQQVDRVEDVFKIIPTPNDPDENSYYIKQEYYTPYNLQEGQKFFLLNCAPCHGNEGDGSGIRSQAMQEAKPRMLTNLDWISSRDDLRLLRSIKYGVPGTSMTPWGDFTNSLQRMQLVMFIRTLSKEQGMRSTLDEKLYQVFDEGQFVIDQARVQLNKALEAYEGKEEEIQNKQNKVEGLIKERKASTQDALNIYQEDLKTAQKIEELQEKDQQLVNLKAEIKRERELYQVLGIDLITKRVDESLLATYFQLIQQNAERYSLQNGQLFMQDPTEIAKKIRKLRSVLINDLDKNIVELEKNLTLIKELNVEQKSQDISSTQADITTYKKLEAKLISNTEEALRSINKQKQIVDMLNIKAEEKPLIDAKHQLNDS